LPEVPKDEFHYQLLKNRDTIRPFFILVKLFFKYPHHQIPSSVCQLALTRYSQKQADSCDDLF